MIIVDPESQTRSLFTHFIKSCELMTPAHRYFVDVAKSHKKQGLAHKVVTLIVKLYHIEQELKDKNASVS